MPDIEVDPRTGVPLNPEAMLSQPPPGNVPQKKMFYGVPVKIAKAGFLLTLGLPVAGFMLGFFMYNGLVDGLIFAGWTYTVSFTTGQIIKWMVRD